MELGWIENWTAKDVLWHFGDCPCISFQLLCPKHCLCCEVARLAAVLQLAKTTWAPWSFISHGIYDPKIDSRNALPLNVFFKGICWSSRFFKIFLCGRHKIQSLPIVVVVLQSIEQKSGFSRFLKHPENLSLHVLVPNLRELQIKQTTVMVRCFEDGFMTENVNFVTTGRMSVLPACQFASVIRLFRLLCFLERLLN